MKEYRAVFEYPTPWNGKGTVRYGYGLPHSSREKAEGERPARPEETFGRRVGVQERDVTEWRNVPLSEDSSLLEAAEAMIRAYESAAPEWWPQAIDDLHDAVKRARG